MDTETVDKPSVGLNHNVEQQFVPFLIIMMPLSPVFDLPATIHQSR